LKDNRVIKGNPIAKTIPCDCVLQLYRAHQKPNFWTEARLKEKSHLFCNVATTFGLTDLKEGGLLN
jgi:hypothetical protein